MSKGIVRAAVAAAVIVVALAGLLVLGSGALRDARRDERRAGAGTPSRTLADPTARATGSADAGSSNNPKAGPAASAKDTRPASGSSAAKSTTPALTALSKEPTRDEILAGLARGEPGYELLASRLPSERTNVTPVWREGDEWLVDTWYRQMQAPNEPWVGPTTWRFRVASETSFRDRPCLELSVTRTDDPAFPPTTFYVTRDHKLAGMHTTVVQQGKQNRITWSPEDDAKRPLDAPFTVVPFDLPPLGADARVLPPGLSHEPPGLPGDVTGAGLPAADAILGHGAAQYELEFEKPTDGSKVYQRWSSTDSRWPVYSRTHTTLSFRRER